MTNEQPAALRLANELETADISVLDDGYLWARLGTWVLDDAAGLLRLLYKKNEALRTELAEERGLRMRLLNANDDEALLRQALGTLAYWLEHGETPGAHDMIQRTHDALQERLIPLWVGKGVGKREHITDGSPCWCNPETTYTDPDTGVSVIVHKEPQ